MATPMSTPMSAPSAPPSAPPVASTAPVVAALIVAAGRGSRMGGELPKQYRLLAGEAVLRHTLRAFLAHPAVAAVRVVIHPDDADLYARAAAGLGLLPPVAGGATRQDSVRAGLESLAGADGAGPPDRVLIHDAARPLVSPALIDRVLAALDGAPAALPALAVVDTLKRQQPAAAGQPPAVAETVARAGLWRAQTPQGFHFQAILAGHREAAGRDLTDDAAVAERAGLTVALVAGDDDNLKITTEDDLARVAQRLATDHETRSGIGFDVHRFTPAGAGHDHVMLGGVRVPHTAGLEGHSDADVVLHAITDALLGTIADGDIGSHFPPGDPAWKGAASARFLAHAAGLIAARGGRIRHVDVTVICERPKVGPHREAIRDAIAAILGIGRARVSVKATTTEGLGFTGRGEGIAAQAVATVTAPAAD
jgi:2-C-methyl-D-erythritol 4-phosphate cytidylyltransferase/2-C-methyl-D-erythritol 2,4-cyclodiphosphate synthase